MLFIFNSENFKKGYIPNLLETPRTYVYECASPLRGPMYSVDI